MRKAKLSRKTSETNIEVKLNIDGKGRSKIKTSLPFLDHMLTIFAKHGMFDLTVRCKGDLPHHIKEDIGIVLGKAFKKALKEKIGIKRYGQRLLPMDETLYLCAVDLSGRPYLITDVEEYYDFFYAFAINAEINIAFKIYESRNEHHNIEAMFKSLARALREACEKDKRETGIASTKGRLNN
ncbi:imidazoleglycerol-phosphate dehydratase HisB [Candidatus Woesearchaeota archaeon]|nr:imidazoleglycerol-phosphate dehydratase HisB [Candidatus Woesearchaeota archaeon]